MSGLGLQSFLATLIVLALVGALAWLVRRGAFGALRQGSRSIAVETAVPIGERRSLIIVAVEGRRLLLGLTPSHIAMVTELGPAPPAPPPQGGSDAASFEQQLIARARGAFGRRSPDDPRRMQARAASDGVRDAVVSPYGDILRLSA